MATRSSGRSSRRRPALLALLAGASIAVALGACTPPDTGPPPTTIPPHDVIVDCVEGEDCDATATTPESSLLIETVGGGSGQITIDVNEGAELDCTGILDEPFYVEVNPNTYTFNSTNGVEKLITITTPDADVVLDAVPGASKWSLQVCFGSLEPFTSLKGKWNGGGGLPFTGPAELDPATNEYVGLLPPCIGSFAPGRRA